jgi:hypothetical protein
LIVSSLFMRSAEPALLYRRVQGPMDGRELQHPAALLLSLAVLARGLLDDPT